MPDDLYQEQILDYAHHPRFGGTLQHPTHSVQQSNLSCGDDLHLDLRVDKQGIIQEIAWQGAGCIISQAAASVVAEHALHQPLAVVQQWALAEIESWLGVTLSAARQKCALLVIRCLRLATIHA